MQIAANTAALRVDYRVKGKTYTENLEGDASKNTAEGSAYPFDSVELAVGQSITLDDDDTLVRVTTLGGAAQPAEQPALA